MAKKQSAKAAKPKASIASDAAIKLVTKLMAIPGKSGEEGAILKELRQRLKAAGIPASAMVDDGANRRIPGGGEGGNLIVKLPGTIKGPRRLLSAHVDTVPLCVGCEPVRKKDRIVSKNPATALGGDDRAGAATLLHTLIEVQRRKLPHPPLTFAWLVQEEVGLLGARHVDKKLLGDPQLTFNYDGGEASVATLGATGGSELQIEIEGVASHAGGHPEQGVSAVAIAGLAISELVQQGWHGLIEKDGIRGTSNVGVIEGGAATNVVMPRLQLRAEARSHDPAFRERIIEAYRTAFERAAAAVRNTAGVDGKLTFTPILKYNSFLLPERDRSVQAAHAAIKQVGLTPTNYVCNGGLDANWLTAHGIPAVTLGCGQHEIHTVREYLQIDEYLAGCQIALLLATATEG